MCQTAGGVNRALSSIPAERKLRDLVTLPVHLNIYRPHPPVHLPVGRKRLWKTHDLGEVRTQDPKSQLVANTCQSVEAYLSDFRPYPAFYFPVWGRRLWK
jgi:hypothetical protein